MNETAIQAQINALVAQRDAAANQVVNLHGELAIAKAEVDSLTKQLEAATAIVADAAEVVSEVPKDA